MSSVSNPGQRGQHKTARRRQQQAKRKARRAARQLRLLEEQAPARVRQFLRIFTGFARPTYYRFSLLVLAAILTVGRHTVLNVLRTLGALVPGHSSSYHRFFSKRRWSMWRLARPLAGWILTHWAANGRVPLVGDETVEEHRGKNVFGKGRHRDGVRSSHKYTAFRYGHKWVVLAILVRFPFARRPWALPVLVALYRSPEEDKKRGRRHKTPTQWMRQMLKVLLRWFPERQFSFAGDGSYASHEMARTAAQAQGRLTLVSRFHGDANLYKAPPTRPGKKRCGRPRVKGAKLPGPAQVVAKTKKRQPLNVAWYGGGRRDVEVVTGTGQWYKAGEGLVAVSWVFVHDCTGTHRDEYFFTTDLSLSAQAVIEMFTGRWSIETTFQEMRAYVGLETTCGWCAKTVLRVAPCLLGLYTVVALLYAELPVRSQRVRLVNWPGKQDVTFSDAITALRRYLWLEWILAIPGHHEAFAKLTSPLRNLLLYSLAPAP